MALTAAEGAPGAPSALLSTPFARLSRAARRGAAALLAASLLAAPAAAAAPPPAPPQELKELEERLRHAVDKASYDASNAYEAARSLAQIPGADAMRLRLELFDAKLETYRGVYLRDWFYSGLLKAATAEEGALLASAACDRKRSDLLRLLCLRAIARCGAPVPAKALLDPSFDHAPPPLRREWQRALGAAFATGRLQAEGREAAGLAERVRKRLEEAGPPYTGLAALPERTPGDGALLLEAALGAKDLGDRAEALRLLQGGEPALQALDAALRSGHCGLRTAALESAVQGKQYRAVPLLIAALEAEAEGERGRFLGDCGRALMALTGQGLGWEPRLWRLWWNERGGAWLQSAEAGQPNASPPPRQDSSATVARMFGLPVDSKRVLVVVDGSGSMLIGKLGEKTCAEAAADELESFLAQLPEDARFNVAVIADEPVPLYRELAAASRKTRAEAVQFLRAYRFGGTSALYDALVWAQNQPGVDTLVLISDGGGSSGSHQYAGHMLDGLRRERERTGVRVHGVCVGSDPPKIRFMEELADMTGGRAVRPD